MLVPHTWRSFHLFHGRFKGVVVEPVAGYELHFHETILLRHGRSVVMALVSYRR